MWSKCSKAIMVAARQGGPDPDANLSLRYAIIEAKAANMPKDTIERAVKKGAGELGGADYETIRYEGYGPGGVAVIVELLTDNRNRSASNVRSYFSKCGGSMGETGSVAFMFDRVGEIVYPAATGSADDMLEAAIEEFKGQFSTSSGQLLVNDEPVEAIEDEDVDPTQITRSVRG